MRSSNKQSWIGIHGQKGKLPTIELKKSKIVSHKTKNNNNLNGEDMEYYLY
jgi:hypothetical protein